MSKSVIACSGGPVDRRHHSRPLRRPRRSAARRQGRRLRRNESRSPRHSRSFNRRRPTSRAISPVRRDLFRALPSAREYPDRLGRASASLAAAGQSHRPNSSSWKNRTGAPTVPAPNRCWRARSRLRAAAVADAESVRKDAAHWIDLKQHLPQEVQDMERDYKAIHAVDLAGSRGGRTEGRGRLAGEEERSGIAPGHRARHPDEQR